MMRKLRNRHLFFIDILFLTLAVYAGYVLRLEYFDLDKFWVSYIFFVGITVATTTILFRITGIYSRYWRYASIDELMLLAGTITTATAISSVITAVTLFLLDLQTYPRSIPLIFLFLGITAVALPRLLIRLGNYRQKANFNQPEKRVVIIGAGDAGTMVARALQNNPNRHYEIIGFVDDDSNKDAMRIKGIPVLGNREAIARIVRANRVQEVIIAIPSASGKVVREILEICEQTNAKIKIIPGIAELVDGTVRINQLREVQIEDLLRRDPVHTDMDAVRSLLGRKRVLVTGGGGSIGRELCRQIIQAHPAELILLGHGENSIFEIYHELRSMHISGVQLTAVIGDVRFPHRVMTIFHEYKPDIVFHAAAHKHVPLMEANPAEAITNNILGTQNLLAASAKVGVSQFVMVSTDKAVNPTNVMGASKRTAELLVHHTARKTGKPYVAVRFGNVLGSRGSVVLTFQKQIKAGGPVTVTHPEMVRFFMTIPEAVQLVLQAATIGQGGEVFMLDMGDPVKIVDLARDVIELSGLEVGEDIDIVFSGKRPGEKLFEEMFVEGEDYKRTNHKKIFIAGNASSFVPDDLTAQVTALAEAAQLDDKDEIIRRLKLLIPEYHPDGYGDATEPLDEMSSSFGTPI